MLHNGDRAGENDIGVDETAELHGVELSAELQPEALPADHARHAEQRQRQEDGRHHGEELHDLVLPDADLRLIQFPDLQQILSLIHI